MKRGMLSRTAVFLFALVVTVVLAIVAMRLLSGIFSRNPDVQFQAFEDDFRAQVRDIGYGSMKQITVQVPSKVSQVCFYDTNPTPEKDANPNNKDLHTGFMDEMAEQGYTVFLVEEETIHNQYQIKGVRIRDKYVACFATGFGHLNVNVEGGEYGTLIIHT